MTVTVVIPWLGVLLAMVVAFAANFLYFGPKTMYPVWARALGRSPDQQPGEGGGLGMGGVFGLTIVALAVQALLLSWTVQAAASLYGSHDVSPGTGLIVGLAMGVGFEAMPSVGHRLFSGQGLKVWAIEAGGDVLGLTLMGLVLSFFV